MLRFHGSKAKRIFEYIGTNSRLDEIQAAALRIFLRELDRWTALRREAAERYRELGLGEALRGSRRTSRATSITSSCRGRLSGTRFARRSRRPRSGAPTTTCRRSISSPRCATSATRRATFPRPSVRRRRTSRCRCGPGSRRSNRSGSSRPCAPRSASAASKDMRSPVNRHRLWQVAVDAVAHRRRLGGRLVRALRRRHRARLLRALPRLGRLRARSSRSSCPVFFAFGFYNRWWRYVSTQDMWGVVRGVAAASVAAFLVFTLLDFHPASVPRGIWFVDLLLLLAFVDRRAPARAHADRAAVGRHARRARQGGHRSSEPATPSQLILREMLKNPALGYTPIGLVDDDPRKKNLRLHGIRVLGTTAELPHLLRDRRPDELLIAIPSASGEVRERIVEIAREGERAGQHASRAPRADHGRLQPGRADPPGRGRGPARPRAGRGRHRLDRGLPDG